MVEGLPLDTEGYNTPSEDSGVCLGDSRTNERWVDSNKKQIFNSKPRIFIC